MNRFSRIGTLFLMIFLAAFAGCGKASETTVSSTAEETPAETKVVSDDPFTRVPTDLSFDNYFSILTEVCGKNSNYGLLYGTTAALCEKNALAGLSAEDNEKPLSNLVNADNLFLLDFSLPEFEDKYVTAEEAELTKVLAKRFCKYVYDTYGFEKLKSLIVSPVDDAMHAELKNEWLKSENVSLTYEPVGCYAFELNDNLYKEDYPYVIREQGFNMYFLTADVRNEGYTDFMKEYYDVHKYAPDDFLDAQEKYWKNLDEKTVEPVDIYTKYTYDNEDDYNYSLAGVFDFLKNQMTLVADWNDSKYALVHEYIHYLDRHHVHGVDGPVFEAYTEELAAYECKNTLRGRSVYETDRAFFERIGAVDAETGIMDVVVYSDVYAIGCYCGLRKQWFSVTAGVTEYWTKDRQKILFSEMSYPCAASFYRFMVEKYGAKKVHLASGTLKQFYDLFEDGYDSLYKEWGDGLVEKYKDLMPQITDFFENEYVW